MNNNIKYFNSDTMSYYSNAMFLTKNRASFNRNAINFFKYKIALPKK